jgi:hypothetical protein
MDHDDPDEEYMDGHKEGANHLFNKYTHHTPTMMNDSSKR